jgi:hypothetical protein
VTATLVTSSVEVIIQLLKYVNLHKQMGIFLSLMKTGIVRAKVALYIQEFVIDKMF